MSAEQAINSLNNSIASAEQAIRTVRAQEAIDYLSASVAEAELTIALADAGDAIRYGQGREAANALAYSIANAEVSIALVNATETIRGVSDNQMLAELDSLLDGENPESADQLISAVIGERPLLASAVQDMAIGAGYDQAMVASSIMSGLGDAAATAAGK